MNIFSKINRSIIILLSITSTVGCQNSTELVPFVSGLDHPVEISHAGDNRLFVIEQVGRIRIIEEDGILNPVSFLDITDRVKYGGEQGLLGLAFHPDYSNNGFFYVNYTDQNNNTQIARFNVVESNPNWADSLSEKMILSIDQPFQNHNGGELSFGPDGYLYIGMGDGGSGGDPGNRAQNLQVLLGKMLRIDIDNGDPYGIPENNPFINDPDALDEIWAYGLRNPWRFSFDRENGDLWIGDVGQNAIEEIDFQPASSAGGENYGWRCYEGSSPYNTNGCTAMEDYVFPVHEYAHSEGCSVTGGFMYRGNDIPALEGYYFFADYCTDYIWTLHQEGTTWIHELFGQFGGNNFSTFGEDASGELYIAGYSSGTIYKFINTTSGVNSNLNTSQVEVFPNPFTNQISIVTDILKGSDAFLVIADFQGKCVYQSELKNNKTTIDLSNLPAGAYVMSLNTNNGKIHRKLSKL